MLHEQYDAITVHDRRVQGQNNGFGSAIGGREYALLVLIVDGFFVEESSVVL